MSIWIANHFKQEREQVVVALAEELHLLWSRSKLYRWLAFERKSRNSISVNTTPTKMATADACIEPELHQISRSAATARVAYPLLVCRSSVFLLALVPLALSNSIERCAASFSVASSLASSLSSAAVASPAAVGRARLAPKGAVTIYDSYPLSLRTFLAEGPPPFVRSVSHSMEDPAQRTMAVDDDDFLSNLHNTSSSVGTIDLNDGVLMTFCVLARSQSREAGDETGKRVEGTSLSKKLSSPTHLIIPRSPMDSSKKTVLITGSTRGIGLAFAEQYTKAGWNVIGTARADSSTEKVWDTSSTETSVLEY
ncbi:NAD(P)-binding domain [Phytophthora cactorum]|nr:NAD(P)-binding domain [Phytophthora cactorum]